MFVYFGGKAHAFMVDGEGTGSLGVFLCCELAGVYV